jgi:ubiquitin
MAKGEQKGNRETKKPKKEKIKTIAAAPSQKTAGWQHPTCFRAGACDGGRAGGASFAELHHRYLELIGAASRHAAFFDCGCAGQCRLHKEIR